ncbi:HEAT repeat domain-containing protein [Kitasatospora sp. NPDC088160]|uniref:HEAT repeat domain-containing protein n=1 Tax=Kitasatospora sp. NPDC088160 TaxID=3364072 RepID=UPI0038292709
MNDMFEALEALTDRDPDRRDVAADVLGDLLRGTALDADSARLVVGRLVSLAVNEPVTKVRESALNSTSEAFDHYRLPLALVEPLTAAMPTMERQLLIHTLYILGATHDPQARPLIEPFLHHPDPEVREEARLAAAELTAVEQKGLTHNS